MDDDIKVALGLLDGRHLAGDEKLATEVLGRAREQWHARVGRWLPDLDGITRLRHERFGDLAFLLEPDLKEARGGLRDLSLLQSLRHVVPFIAQVLEEPELAGAGEVLTAARVELHRLSGRATDALLLQDQDGVAVAVGATDAGRAHGPPGRRRPGGGVGQR